MRLFHRLLYDSQQLFAQLLQVDLVAQHSGECGKRMSCIVLPAIETAVNALLNTSSKRLEECRSRFLCPGSYPGGPCRIRVRMASRGQSVQLPQRWGRIFSTHQVTPTC